MRETTERRVAQLMLVAVIVAALPALALAIVILSDWGSDVVFRLLDALQIGAGLLFSALALGWAVRQGERLGKVGAILGLVGALAALPIDRLDDVGLPLEMLVELTASTGRWLVALAIVRRYPSTLSWTGLVLFSAVPLWHLVFTIQVLASDFIDNLTVLLFLLVAGAVGPILVVIGSRDGLARGIDLHDRVGGDLHEAAGGLSWYRHGLVIGLCSGALGLLLTFVGRSRGAVAVIALLMLAGSVTSQVFMLIGLTRFRRVPSGTGAQTLATACWALVLTLTAVAGVMALLQLAALGDRGLARDLSRSMGAIGTLLSGLFAQILLFFSLERVARALDRDDLARRSLMLVGFASGGVFFTLVASLSGGDRDLIALLILSGFLAVGALVTVIVFVFLTLPPLERQMRAGVARSPFARPDDHAPSPAPEPSPAPVEPARSPFARPLDPPG